VSGGNKTLKVFLIGLLAIVGGAAYIFVLPRFAGGVEARVRAQEPMSMSELRERPAGSPVVVEGLVGMQNETRYRSLVAYRRVITVEGPDGHSYPVEEDRVSPPLSIDLAGGAIQLEGGYRLEATTQTWATSQYNYEGFNQGSKVLVVGERTADGRHARELFAEQDSRPLELLCPGTVRGGARGADGCRLVAGLAGAAPQHTLMSPDMALSAIVPRVWWGA
jgi:hypothetical protein